MKEIEIKTKLDNELNIIIAICLIGIFFEGFLCSLPIFGSSIKIILCILSLFLIAVIFPICRNVKRDNIYPTLNVLFISAYVISNLVSGQYNTRSTTVASIRFLLLLLSYIILMNLSKWQMIYIRLLYAFGMLFILTTIWLTYDTASYERYFSYSMYPNSAFNFIRGTQGGHTAGITDHYSHNGIMLGNSLVVIFSFFMVRRKKRVHLFFIILNVIAMVMCGKRAQVLFPIMAIALAYMIYSKKNLKTILLTITILIVLLILTIILYNNNITFQNYINRYSDMDEDGSVLSRFSYWQIAFDHFRQRPIFGNGWLSYRSFHPRNQDAHNNYVQLLCDVGITGEIVFCSFFIYNLFAAYKNLLFAAKFRNDLQDDIALLCLFSFIYQVYFLLYAITGNPLQLLYSFCPYIAACAISIFYKNYFSSEKFTEI